MDEIISQAREAAEDFTAELPDFVVQQLTARYYSSTVPAKWRALDVVSAEVVSVNGKEEYRNISRNGRRTRQPIETTGSWSTGEFVTTLQDVLSPITAAEFVKRAGNPDRQSSGLRLRFQSSAHRLTLEDHRPGWQFRDSGV